MSTTPLDGDLVLQAWLGACRGWNAQIAELTAQRDHAIELIKERLGNAEEATIGGMPVVTWAWSKPGKRLDRKALEADQGPEFVEKYLVENTPARPFRILDVTP